jgi:hypothetical protein
MTPTIVIASIVLVSLLSSCKGHVSESVSEPVLVPIPFQEVDTTAYGCFFIPDSGTTVIKSDSLWSWYWTQFWRCTYDGTRKTPAPRVDFSTNMVIAVHYGEGYSGCRNRVDVIKNIYRLRDTIHVAIDHLPFLGYCTAWIKPLEMVTISLSVNPVIFEPYIRR